MAQAVDSVLTKKKSPKVKWHPKMEVLVIVGSSNMQVDDMLWVNSWFIYTYVGSNSVMT